ncbi:MAG: hypothetical protein M3Y87_23885 [Myxococcota bacterium]|nr:hypothetical protein [Myxococcota bacterium]
MRARLVGVFVLASGIAGCTECGGGRDRAAEARGRVEQLFAAGNARDCETTRALMPRVTNEHECEELFEDWEHHGMELLEIVDARVDGRDEHAVVVRCRVRMRGREREMLVRAEETEDGRWGLSL